MDVAIKDRQNSTLLCTFALLAISLFFCVPETVAVDPSSHVSQYGHTVWRLQDGYFGGMPEVIIQTTDGYVWVGTESGLFKFDGVRFVPWSGLPGDELPSSKIFSLLGARDGTLWIGTDSGLAHLVNNRLTLYGKNEGWTVWSLIEDREGKVWFERLRPEDRTHPLCQVLDTGVRCYGSKDGVDSYGLGPIAEDPSGDLWVGSNTTLVRWRPGAAKVYRPRSLRSNQGNDGITSLAPANDGSLWVGIGLPGRGAGLQRLVDGVLEPFRAPQLNGETLNVSTLYGDRQNSLWVGTSQGLFRIRGADVDHFGSAEGLSSDSVLGIFEDREGNLWVATAQGVDMFRDLCVRSFSKRQGLNEDAVESVAASRDGSVWIGTSRLLVLGSQGVSSSPGEALPGNQVTSLFVDHSGRLWTGMNNRLFIYERGGFRQITKPDGSALGMVMGITEDSEHSIWVESTGPPGTLFRIKELKVTHEFPEPGTPLARKIVADPQDGIWLGLVTGDLARLRDGQIQTFTSRNHPNSRVLSIARASDGSILGGTNFGVVGWKNGKQQILTMQNGLPCNGVTALISDSAGNPWLYSECGLIEIPSEQMEQWWQHPDSKLNVRVFDTFDGVQPGLGHFNTSARTPDGRLWFANGAVVQMIDPSHIPENTLPPPVHISSLVADRKTYTPTSAIRLPARTRDLEIDYAALSYVAPQKVLFRYMLEGHDVRWQEPGTRRQAFYNDLPPGPYRFRVIACNNNGLWNEAGASLNFSILPAFYQTVWFRAACAVAFLLLLWTIYRLRIRQLQRQFTIGVEARVNERTRIARELHDTLLQTLHGLMFQFQAARNLLPGRPGEAMRSLDDAIDDTGKALAESRDAIKDLRSEPLAQANLAELLKAASKELADTSTGELELPRFDLIEEGERKVLSPTANDEVCRIALELLRNAFRHAKASRIEAEVRYDDQALRIRIRDNGVGIDPRVLKEGGRPGHWGLKGVIERAERIGSHLDFWSEAGAGTEIELTVPASVAYETLGDSIGSKLIRTVRNYAQRS
jgi:signal transduction histidine kinase/ligand-binding sensor domain-containing protein